MSKRIKRFAACCGVALLGLLPALVGAQQLSLRYHATTEGLGNLVVNVLAHEPGGALWIGTEHGLYRHSGEGIRRVEGGPEQDINSIVFGVDGTLWVGAENGLFRRGTSGFVAAQANGDATWSVARGQTLAALPDGGVLVVGDEGKLWRVAPHGEDVHLVPALPATLVPSDPHALDVRSILVARDGAWWFGCGQALCRWFESQLERWGAADGVPQGGWLGLLEAQDGSIWARSDRHVVRRAAGAARFANVTPQRLNQGANMVWLPLSEDSAGRVLTPGDAGVFRWQAGSWQHLGERNGLAEDGLRAIVPDREGDVWLGTTGHGLLHWRGYDHWSSWTARQGLPSDAVWSIADDGAGRVWIGTQRGVVSTDHGGTELVREASAVTGQQIVSMKADGRGGMWLTTSGGDLYHRARGASWRVMTHSGELKSARMLAVDGELWVATVAGLFTTPLDGSGPVRRRDELDRLVANGDRRINTLCREADSGVIWLGTGSELLRFDPASGFERPQVQGLAPSSGVVYLACGAGRVWLRTAMGKQLMRIDLTRTAALRAEPMTPPVLKGRRVLSLLEDHRGWLWAGTDAGVVRWNGRDWRLFDESNGLAWNDCDQNALTEDAQGAIWVGTSSGVSRIDDPERLRASAPMALKLSEAKLGSVDLLTGRGVAVPWSTQPLEVRWEVPLFSNRQAQHTRYRLHGRDDAWADITRSELRYAGLGPGRYNLELIAVNDDLEQSSPPVVLQFEIAPPWWQSPPALAAALVLVLLLGYAAYRWRIRRLVRHQTALEALVGERTRELAKSHERMRELAFTDSLTGAMNRRAILELAARELAQRRRHGGALTLVLLDLDHFKRVNDNHGHPAGDALLCALVRRLRARMRDGDCIGRYGGEEFLLVLPALSLNDPGAVERIDAWRRAVAEQPFDVGGTEPLSVTCSMGVASVAFADETVESLVARADAALYRAKATGRNRVEV